MVDAMVAFCAEKNLAMSVAVVDNTDTLVYLAKMDGAVPMTARVAVHKAHTALAMRRDTAGIVDYLANVKGASWFIRWGDPRFAPILGGVLIREQTGSDIGTPRGQTSFPIPPTTGEGYIIGAVGVCGGSDEEDEEAARFAASVYKEVSAS